MNNSIHVSMVRIYLTETKHYEDIMTKLHDHYQVMGVTAFRGIAGFGQSGEMHSTSLLDISLDLPVILEFFDVPEKIDAIVTEIEPTLKHGHLVTWSAQTNL